MDSLLIMNDKFAFSDEDEDETNEVDEDEDELRDQFGSMNLQDVQTRWIQLAPTIQDTMWYV